MNFIIWRKISILESCIIHFQILWECDILYEKEKGKEN